MMVLSLANITSLVVIDKEQIMYMLEENFYADLRRRKEQIAEAEMHRLSNTLPENKRNGTFRKRLHVKGQPNPKFHFPQLKLRRNVR
jgi:hypothetical protein